jgi:hypothetical protein
MCKTNAIKLYAPDAHIKTLSLFNDYLTERIGNRKRKHVQCERANKNQTECNKIQLNMSNKKTSSYGR